MRRASTAARTLPDRLRGQQRAITENARSQGRGATALRDSAGNVMTMRGNAPYPLLTPQGIDAAVAFDGTGTVKMVSPDTQEDRDLTARGIYASGNSSVTGHLGVVGQLEADTMGTKTLGVGTCNAARVNTGTTYMAGGVVRLDGGNLVTDFNNGASGGTVYTLKVECGDVVYNNLIKRSDPALKDRRRKLDRSALAAVGGVAWDMWRYRPDAERVTGGEPGDVAVLDPEPAVVPPPTGPIQWTTTGGLIVPAENAVRAVLDDPTPMPEGMPVERDRDHVGPMADELDDQPLLATCVVHDEQGAAVGIDYGSLVGVLGAALSETHTRLVAQARTIAGLRAQQKTDRDRLDQIEERLAALEGTGGA